MANYQVKDAYGSVITIEASVVGGGAFRQILGATVAGNQSVSGAVNLGAGTAVIGSVATLQGTNPWTIGSIVGTYAEDAASANNDKGLFTLGVRNDTVASLVSADLDYVARSHDSAGRTLTRPFAPEEARVEGYSSTVNTSQTTLIAAPGAGLRLYITDIWFANTGTANPLITFKDGGGSVLGYTIAPTLSGSNLPGLQTPIRTGVNTTFDFQAATGTSVLYATVKGYKAP